jgi:SAM-dependent methyltransferase
LETPRSAAPELPGVEREFEARLERFYLARGVAPRDPLLRHWIEAMGPRTYLAGERVVRELQGLLPLAGRRLLDVGCGFGGVLIAALRLGAIPVGLNASPDELALCRERLDLHGTPCPLLRGDGFRLPFPDASFDVVASTEVLEHIRGHERWVGEMCRVLRRGGALYLSFPNRLSLANLLRDPHYNLFGVALLPPAWARPYTRLRRGCEYEVEMLPVAASVARICAGHGVPVYSLVHSEEVLLRKIDAPGSIRDGRLRTAFSILHGLGLAPLLRGLVRLKSTTGASGVLAGLKP